MLPAIRFGNIIKITSKCSEATEKLSWENQMHAFNASLGNELRKLEQEHQQDPTYQASVLPIRSSIEQSNITTEVLILDGQELKDFATDVFLDREKLTVHIHNLVDQGVRLYPREKTAAEAPERPKIFSWNTLKDLSPSFLNMMESIFETSRINIINRYAAKAQVTQEINY